MLYIQVDTNKKDISIDRIEGEKAKPRNLLFWQPSPSCSVLHLNTLLFPIGFMLYFTV